MGRQADPALTAAVPWQLRLFARSLKKKEKLGLLRDWLGSQAGCRVLDLGCAKGTLSRLLRELGGIWVHADLDQANLIETLALVGRGVARVGPGPLPFRSGAFDTVVTLDFLEHVENDGAVLAEIARVLRPGGRLIVSTPLTGPVFLLNRAKRVAGLPPEIYGHVREGYRMDELAGRIAEHGLAVERRTTYARFFTELLETAVNLAFVQLARRRRRPAAEPAARRDGAIAPGSGVELARHEKAFQLYSAIYPIAWAISRLDRLIPFIQGYAGLIAARRAGSGAASRSPSDAISARRPAP